MRRALLIAGLAGCAGGPDDTGRPFWASDGCAQPLAPGAWTRAHDGRAWLIDVPPVTGPVPLVLDLHGSGGNAALQRLYSGFAALGTDEGFATVIPDSGEPDGAKRWDTACDSPDVGFVGGVLDAALDEACIDTRRVFVTGVSNGGTFSHVLAAGLEGRVAAIGPIAGSLGQLGTECAPSSPLPVVITHGTADADVVPAHGEAARDWWVAHNGCPAVPTAGACDVYAPCAAEVRWCAAEGVGHVDIYAAYPTTARIWAFFADLH